MKKSVIVVIIAILVVLLVLGVVFCVKFFKKSDLVEGVDYYLTSYLANPDNSKILDSSGDYKVISNREELIDILNKVSENNYDETFNDEFFENKNLLIIEGGMDSKIQKLNIKDTELEIEIYEATPEVDLTESYDFDLYLIPIGKNVSTIKVDVSVNPNVLY